MIVLEEVLNSLWGLFLSGRDSFRESVRQGIIVHVDLLIALSEISNTSFKLFFKLLEFIHFFLDSFC